MISYEDLPTEELTKIKKEQLQYPWVLRNVIKIEHDLNNYIRVRKNLETILDDAARAERFLARPNNNRCPSMYQIIETSIYHQRLVIMKN